MAHPSNFFIKLRLARSWASAQPETVASINQTLRELRLLPLLESQFDEIVSQFSPPRSFCFNNRKHGPTAEFMRRERIYEMWMQKAPEGTAVATYLMSQHALREKFDVLLMGGVSVDEIVKWVSVWAAENPYCPRELVINERVVLWYRHFFMNRWLTTVSELDEMLRDHSRRDSLVTALRGGPDEAKHRVGIRLRPRDKMQPLRDALVQVSLRMEALRDAPTNKSTVDLLARLSATAIGLHERLFGEGDDAAEAIMNMTRHFRLVHSTEKIPSIQEIAANGSYSGDGEAAETERASSVDTST